MLWSDGKLEVARAAPKRASAQLPFAIWMALAKATPLQAMSWDEEGGPGQAPISFSN